VFLKKLDEFLNVQSQFVQLASPPGVTQLVIAPLFFSGAGLLMFATPLLAMRSIAEERRNQTMVFLTSAPVTMTQIVLGKFAGLMAFIALIVALIAAMPLTLSASTRLDYAHIAALVGGVLLLAAGFAALSLYVSSLTTHPMAAAFGAFALLLVMLSLGDAAVDGLQRDGWAAPAALLQVFSPLRNFEPMIAGIVDTSAIAASLLLVAFFLTLTVRRLDALRLRG
jgi:ABC-2 type transport system permease protein